MKALVFGGNGKLDLKNVPDPKITRADEVLIRIKATGICGTDIHILGGEYPAKQGVVLGHESAGVVEEVGSDVRRFKRGDRVILDPTYHCGMCYYCTNNRPNYCDEKAFTETGVSADGTFAELHVARQAFLHPLPDDMPFEIGALTEPLACMLNALKQTRIHHESRVLIVGAGPIGLMVGIATSAMGCEVHVGDIDPWRLEQASSVLKNVHDFRGDGLEKAGGKDRFDIIADTSGRMLEKLLPKMHRGGDLLMLGLDYSFEAKIKPCHLVDNGIRIIGSLDTNRTMAPAITMLRRDERFKRVISHRVQLEEYKQGFSALGVNLDGGARGKIAANKVVVLP